MPLPVIAGIPFLASLLATIATSIFTFFLKFFTYRTAIVAAVVSVIVLLTAGFFSLLSSLALGLSVVVPPEFTLAVSLVVPSNLPIIVSTILSARVARWAYDWQIKIVQLKLF